MGQYWRLVCWDKWLMTRNLGKLGEFFYKSSYDEFEFVIDALSLERRRRKDPLGRRAPVKKVPVPVRLACAGVEMEEGYRNSFYRYVYDNFQEINSDMAEKIRKAKTAEREMTGDEEDPAEFVVLNESRKEYI
ncbi:hypothetical protein EV182_005603, partial [Spiromyces aspiralis]